VLRRQDKRAALRSTQLPCAPAPDAHRPPHPPSHRPPLQADRVNVPNPGSDNDEAERHSLSPTMWFLARAAAVRAAAQMGQAAHVEELAAAALAAHGPPSLLGGGAAAAPSAPSASLSATGATISAGASLPERLHCTGLAHERALALAAQGRTSEALDALTAVIGTYRGLHVADGRLVAALLDAAQLRDRLGLRADAAELALAALAVAEAHAAEMGLGEALAAPELASVYADGTAAYAAALAVAARVASRRQQHAEAERRAAAVLRLLRRHTRALPAQHAEAALALGRAARLVALCGDGAAPAGPDALLGWLGSPSPGGVPTGSTRLSHEPVTATGVAATAAKLSAARAALCSAITVACTDAGHLRGVVRSALLELASLFVAAADARAAAACLRGAGAAAAKLDLLLLSSHQLAPVAAAQLPEWAVAHVKGQEARFGADPPRPDKADKAGDGSAALSEADTSRMVVCHLAALLRALDTDTLPAGSGARARAQAQVAALHTALRAACVKYGTDACFAEPPLPPTGAADAANGAPPEGTVLAQWHYQDGCWQVCTHAVAPHHRPPASHWPHAPHTATPRSPAHSSFLSRSLPHLARTPRGPAANLPRTAPPLATPTAPLSPPSPLTLQSPSLPSSLPSSLPAPSQEARSWRCDGSSGAGPGGAEGPVPEPTLLSLKPVEAFASLLWVVAAPASGGGLPLQCGEVTFPLREVRALQRRAKQLRSRVERPRGPTELLGQPAPSEPELLDLLKAVERLLSAVPRSSEDGSSVAGSGALWGAGLGSDDGLMEGAVRPPLDGPFLAKLEALLAVDAGLEAHDATFGAWLVQTLPVGM
jgi:hypothetical protein